MARTGIAGVQLPTNLMMSAAAGMAIFGISGCAVDFHNKTVPIAANYNLPAPPPSARAVARPLAKKAAPETSDQAISPGPPGPVAKRILSAVGQGESTLIQDLARESYDFWRAKGFDHNAALSMLAQEQGESNFDIRAIGDNGSAVGIFQWHPDRRAQIFTAIGVDIAKANHNQQLEAAYWEMTKGSRRGLAQHMQSLSLRDAVAMGVRRFEGSANQNSDIEKRLRMAMNWDGGSRFSGSVKMPTTEKAFPQDSISVDDARRYLASVASGGATRPDAITNLSPDFSIRAASLIKDARANGLPNAGIFSAYRSPSQTGSRYDAQGFSGHSYGIAGDFSGIGEPGSPEAIKFDELALKHGFSGYGPDNLKEWNHKELLGQHLQYQPKLLEELKASLDAYGKPTANTWQVIHKNMSCN